MSGVSIRDKQRMPFVMVSKPALAAIRRQFTGRRGQAALAVYVAIIECANDERSDHFSKSRPEIAKRGMVNVRTLDSYVDGLESLGLIRVERVKEGSWHRPNLWTLTDPPGSESDCITSAGGGESDCTTPSESNCTTGSESNCTTGSESNCTPITQEEKKVKEAPLPPASGGRRRDKDRYGEELRQWISAHLPELDENAYGLVRAAIGQGRTSLDDIRAYVNRWTAVAA